VCARAERSDVAGAQRTMRMPTRRLRRSAWQYVVDERPSSPLSPRGRALLALLGEDKLELLVASVHAHDRTMHAAALGARRSAFVTKRRPLAGSMATAGRLDGEAYVGACARLHPGYDIPNAQRSRFSSLP
jgi:hypothetical protein